MPKCPPFWHFGTAKTCQIMSTRKFWNVSAKTKACGRDDHLILGAELHIRRRDDHFFALRLILGGKLDICGRDVLQRTCPLFVQ